MTKPTRTIGVFLADDHTVVRQAMAEMIARSPGFAVAGQCGDGLQMQQPHSRPR